MHVKLGRQLRNPNRTRLAHGAKTHLLGKALGVVARLHIRAGRPAPAPGVATAVVRKPRARVASSVWSR